MKVFAMLMLRCALFMHLCSLLRNGTVATRESWLTFNPKVAEWTTSSGEFGEWVKLCRLFFVAVSHRHNIIALDDLKRIPQTKNALNALLEKVKEFPLKDEMEELLDRRLQKPLKMAISNCDKLLNEVEHSGLKNNKKYLQSLLSKIRSIANGIKKEFNTFIIEVELELIKKVVWTSDERLQILLEIKTESLLNLSKQQCYYDVNSFENAIKTLQNQKQLDTLILESKLSSLENELSAKIAEFEEQQPHIDGDGFIEFSRNFEVEWKLIEQKIGQANSFDLAKKEEISKKLDDLAKNALNKTAQLKDIITKKLDELVTKCHNDGVDAMKDVINDIGMFDGAANKLLVSLEQKLDKTEFSCAKFEEAVKQDKKMVSTAYQVKDKIYTDDEMMDVTDG